MCVYVRVCVCVCVCMWVHSKYCWPLPSKVFVGKLKVTGKLDHRVARLMMEGGHIYRPTK